MKYTVVPAPQEANEGWMAHRVEMFLKNERREELREFLELYCGDEHVSWRITNSRDRWIWGDKPQEIRFLHKRHAAQLKLQWAEDPDPMKAMLDAVAKYTRAFKNQNLSMSPRSSGATIGPTTSGLMPWYNTYGKFHDLSLASLYPQILYKPSEPRKPYWNVEVLKSREARVITTEELQRDLARRPHLPSLPPPSALTSPASPADRTSE